MAQRDRLRGLQVGKAGHDAARMLAGAGDQRDLQRLQPGIGLVHGIAHPEAEVGRHLIVARTRGVQPPCGRADQFGKSRFGGHVDVLEVPVLGHAVGLVLGGDFVQTVADRDRIGIRNDAASPQHRDVRLAGGYVLPPQCLVEGNRGVYLAHDCRRSFREPSAPHLVGASRLAVCHIAQVARPVFHCRGRDPLGRRLR